MIEQQSVDVVIITALEKERDAVLDYLDESKLDKPEQVPVESRIVHKFKLRHDNEESFYQVVLWCIGNMGNAQASCAATSAILALNPNIVILTGIAGGVKEKNKRHLGDLIIPDQIVGYAQGKITNAGIEHRYQVLRPDYALLEVAKNFSFTKKATMICPEGEDKSPAIHTGTVGSSDWVIADDQTIPELQSSWTKLIGVEMESYGAALAVHQAESRPRFLMVKGICDWADPKKDDTWQKYAADVAAAFVIDLLKSKPFFNQSLHYSGKIKILFCDRLGDSWRKLADYFEIKPSECQRFYKGDEGRAIWEWLENREKLYALKEALRFAEREDLVKLLDTNNK